jgi:hypothetical protein
MAVLQEDLFVALSRAACSPNLACLSGSCQVPPSICIWQPDTQHEIARLVHAGFLAVGWMSKLAHSTP